MDVTINEMIAVDDPTREVSEWCEKHLVLTNPDFEKKSRMGFWTRNTPKQLRLYERVGNRLYLPFGTLRGLWPMIREADVETDFPEPVDVNYGPQEVPLYDYQKEAVTRMMNARYGILQSPAGSGKTQMGIALIKRFERRALWLTHTADLLRQSKERAERYVDPALLGTITEGKVDIGQGVTFATVQTMCRLDPNFYRDLFDVVIVDECHHAAGTPTRLSQFSKVLNSLNARHKYGLSATVHRSDGLIEATYALLGGIVHTVPPEAVAEKIMQVGVCPRATGVPLSEACLNGDGTLNYGGMISYLAGHLDRNRQIAGDITREKEHSCLILSDRLEHLERLMRMLPKNMQDKAAMISGKMTSKREKALREQVLEDMRQGKLQYLFATYSLAKEGLDIPRLDRLFLATPVKDEAVVIQSLGRIARTFPDKGQPIAYDYIDSIQFCKRAYKQRCRHYNKIGVCYVPEA